MSHCVGVVKSPRSNVSWSDISADLSSPGVPWHPQILADQLPLHQLGGADYAHHITYVVTTGTAGFSDLPTALFCGQMQFPSPHDNIKAKVYLQY